MKPNIGSNTAFGYAQGEEEKYTINRQIFFQSRFRQRTKPQINFVIAMHWGINLEKAVFREKNKTKRRYFLGSLSFFNLYSASSSAIPT